jgi:putative ABC transport system permease protein
VMLGRGLAREREVTVRLALGAAPGRVIRQFLTESLLISISGGVLGIVVGYAFVALLKGTFAALPLTTAILPILIPAEASILIDSRVLSFATVLSIVSGVAFGLAPAIATTRASRAASIGSGRRTSTTVVHRRVRGALVVAEVALAFVLVANAGLLIRSFVNMRQTDTGFDAANVLTAELPVREHRFADVGQLRAFMHRIVANVRALPGVSDVAFTDGMPLQGVPTGMFFQIASRPVVERAQRPVGDFRLVSPAYFRVLGLRLRRGRVLSDLDRDDTPLVAVINETLARQYFANEDAVGQHLLMNRPGFGTVYSGETSSFEIVGVIADERLTPFDDKREHAAIYVSNEQDGRGFAGVVVRTSLGPVLDAARAPDGDCCGGQGLGSHRGEDARSAEVGCNDSGSPEVGADGHICHDRARTIGDRHLRRDRIFGGSAHAGNRHPRGSRCQSANLVGLIVGGGIWLAAAGLALGCVAAIGVNRLLSSFLFGVGSSDFVTLIATAGVLAAVATVACYIPARNATRIDPLTALRAE